MYGCCEFEPHLSTLSPASACKLGGDCYRHVATMQQFRELAHARAINADRTARSAGLVRYSRCGVAEDPGEPVGPTDAIARGEGTGVALPGGKTPAPESGAGDDFTGDCADVAVGAAEASVPVCCFSSSRRSALSPLVL